MRLLLAALALTPANVDVRAYDLPQRWSPSTVEIEVGDSVTWRFEGTSLAHNVASTGTNWSFRTPFDSQPATFTFTAPGTYRFVCQAHAFTMNGLVKVGVATPEPEPGGGPLENGEGRRASTPGRRPSSTCGCAAGPAARGSATACPSAPARSCASSTAAVSSGGAPRVAVRARCACAAWPLGATRSRCALVTSAGTPPASFAAR